MHCCCVACQLEKLEVVLNLMHLRSLLDVCDAGFVMIVDFLWQR
jgi:pentatricopeptide repeat protein